MTEAKFTPGPWRLQVHTGTGQYITSKDDWTVNGSDGQSVCWEGYPNDNAEANARLIAAAPELYEALQMLSNICYGTFAEGGTPHKAAIAALAKARGE